MAKMSVGLLLAAAFSALGCATTTTQHRKMTPQEQTKWNQDVLDMQLQQQQAALAADAAMQAVIMNMMILAIPPMPPPMPCPTSP